MLEDASQFIGTLLGSFALAHHVLDVRLHVAANLRLFDGVVGHRLFHLLDGLLQRIDYLAEVGVAGIVELLLTLFQHFVGGSLHLLADLGNCLVEALLLGLH